MPFLSDENRRWQEKARHVAEEVVRPIAAKYDALQEYPWEVKEVLAREGLMGVWIPKEYGGAGGGILDQCLCVEQLSRACGGVGVLYAVNALGSIPIILAGTDEQKKKYLPRIAAGEFLIAFALSEKFAGSDAGSQRTAAVADGDHYVIDGEKKWTTNGGVAELYTVFAVTDPQSKKERMSGFLVEKNTPGFAIAKVEDKTGIRCVPVVEVDMKSMRVQRSQLLGGTPGLGFKHAMMTLDRARPGVAAQAVGLAQGALDLAVVYANRRQQFGQQIASFQMIQQLLADMSARVSAARYLVYNAARAIDRGLPNMTRLAAEAKMFASDTAMKVTSDAVQVFGGYGYMKDYPIEKYMRDAKITQIYEGTNQVQRIVIARALAKEAEGLAHLEKYIPRETQRGVE